MMPLAGRGPEGFASHAFFERSKLKALSVRQPWAWCIFHAGKDVENRSFHYKYRGPCFIHSPTNFDHDGYEYLKAHGIRVPSRAHFLKADLFGRMVGVVQIKCTLPKVYDEPCPVNFWFTGPYGLFLDREKIEFEYPFKFRGQRGLYQIDMGLVAAKLRDGDWTRLRAYLNISST